MTKNHFVILFRFLKMYTLSILKKNKKIFVQNKNQKCHEFRFNDLMSSRTNDHFIVPKYVVQLMFVAIHAKCED